MGELRTPPKTWKRMNQISEMTDTRQALESIVDLFANYVSQEEKTSKGWKPHSPDWLFSQDEIKNSPELASRRDERKWSPYFEPRIYIPRVSGLNHHPESPVLANKVVNEIKRAGSLSIETKLGTYVFFLASKSMSGSEPIIGAYNAGCTTSVNESQQYISVKKIGSKL